MFLRKQLTIFAKIFILGVQQGSEHVSADAKQVSLERFEHIWIFFCHNVKQLTEKMNVEAEKWKWAVDKNLFVVKVPMYLPRAFTCIQHDLVIITVIFG